jgi:hypothetical protein
MEETRLHLPNGTPPAHVVSANDELLCLASRAPKLYHGSPDPLYSEGAAASSPFYLVVATTLDLLARLYPVARRATPPPGELDRLEIEHSGDRGRCRGRHRPISMARPMVGCLRGPTEGMVGMEFVVSPDGVVANDRSAGSP